MAEPRIWLVTQLGQQLEFLKRSCDVYDDGCLDEAIRMAVVLRVLFHSTSRQDSLIRQLRAEGIELLSTCREYCAPKDAPGQMTRDVFMGLAPVEMSSAGIRLRASLDAHTFEKPMPFQDWWMQVVFVLPSVRKQITRKAVVTSAANKQGAHVDTHLTEEYKALIVSPHLYHVFRRDLDFVSKPLGDAHYPALRQMAYEVLHSPSLLDLAKST